MPAKKPRFIFTIGGVLSGLGKGVTTASMGLLLKSRGFKVTAIKIDPYISIDAGTMRPAEHGEVFVTRDGGEIDQDLGNYERFLDLSLTKDHNITTGKVFREVIKKERSFYYAGRDAELIPDVINEIKEQIFQPLEDEEIVLVEIGGTTGDLENLPFLYAARELAREYSSIFVMIVYLPFLKNVGELKTKPAQHAMARLREVGIFANLVITRAEIPLDRPRAETLAKRCFLNKEDIIDNPDLDSIYKIPILFENEGLVNRVIQKLDLHPGQTNKRSLEQWRAFAERLSESERKVKIALVGKYVTHGAGVHRDVYISVLEALNHAASRLSLEAEVIPIDSERIEKEGLKILEKLKPQGILVPQGWGQRGVEGKIAAIRFARENKVPFLGLCFGMQMAVIEFARHVLGLSQANSTEVNANTPHPVVHLMPDQEKYLKNYQYGGTIRLGSWPCQLDKNSLIYRAYRRLGMEKNSPWWQDRQGKKYPPGKTVFERHRHRYEINNNYRPQLEKGGLHVAGTSPDGELIEAVEIVNHPFFIATQFHPEYQSRPLNPHPLFVKFLNAAGDKL